MIKIDLRRQNIHTLRNMDDWISEHIIFGRPEGDKAFWHVDIDNTNSEIIATEFLYPEDELAFKLKFQVE